MLTWLGAWWLGGPCQDVSNVLNGMLHSSRVACSCQPWAHAGQNLGGACFGQCGAGACQWQAEDGGQGKGMQEACTCDQVRPGMQVTY